MPSATPASLKSGKNLPRHGGGWIALGVVLISIAVSGGMTYILYGSMQRVFREGIDERLKSMASIAAINFNSADLDRITGAESVGTKAYEQAVMQLQRIRSQATNIRYAYILRRTSDPNTMGFVADADSLHPDEKIDLNGDGVIDDEDALTYPGDPYDVTPFPEFRAAAFDHSFVDPDFTISQWGIFLAGTAPIRYANDPSRSTNYVIGLDLNVTQYWQLLQSIYIPFIGFAFFLLTVIALLTIALRVLWKRQVRQLAQIDRQKDELINLVSHQLKSPIASIRWNFNDFLDGEFGPLTEEQKKQMQSDLKTTDNILELVALLLDVSRIELGKLQMDKKKQNLKEFFSEIITVVQELAKEKDVQFIQTLSPSLPAEGTFDKRLTHMTVENLLTNAVKYTPTKGTVELKVEMVGNTMHCAVKDTGIGIPKEDQKQLFSKMFRASNVKSIEGTGLGLYVAKGAIEQQGGKLWFESISGKGTTFFMDLPL